VDAQLADLADRQGGLIALTQAVALGCPAGRAARSLRSAGWSRLVVGAYLAPGVEATFAAEIRARLLVRPDLIACRSSAAHLLGLSDWRPRLEFITVGSAARCLGARVYRDRVAEEDIVARWGAPVTRPLRTVVDLLRYGSVVESVVTLDSAAARRQVPLNEVARELERLAGRRGVSRAWRSFALADPAAESPLESLARLRMRQAGLHPRSQVQLTVGGLRYRVDFVVDGVGVEIEGVRYHGGIDEHQRDVRRFNALVSSDARLPILRFTWDDVVRHPDRMIAVIKATIADRGAA